MHRLLFFWIVLIGSTGIGCQDPIDVPVIGGTYIGYVDKYSETPVVRESADIGSGYTARFRAYDLGDEARFVAYAQREKSGEYFAGIMRLSVRDPDGNTFTVYRNFEAEPVDAPIIWHPRMRGNHTVQLEFQFPGEKGRAEFVVPLVRKPAPAALLAGVGFGIVIAVGAVGFFLRKRRRSA